MGLPDVFLAALACLAGCVQEHPRRAELSVAGAASLRELLRTSEADFVAERGGDVALSFSFAASSTLARQIAAGAPFEVFVSADPLVLEHAGKRIDPAEARVVLSNRMALVARPGASLPDGPGELVRLGGTIAVAAPSVPAGRYARELLAERGLLETLSPRLIRADHVRAALALVESGATDYGFVYATDAALARRARTAWICAPGEGPAITYVALAVGDTQASALARAYLDFLAGDAFADRARSLGFGVDR